MCVRHRFVFPSHDGDFRIFTTIIKTIFKNANLMVSKAGYIGPKRLKNGSSDKLAAISFSTVNVTAIRTAIPKRQIPHVLRTLNKRGTRQLLLIGEKFCATQS